jgi:hypothetical protein
MNVNPLEQSFPELLNFYFLQNFQIQLYLNLLVLMRLQGWGLYYQNDQLKKVQLLDHMILL